MLQCCDHSRCTDVSARKSIQFKTNDGDGAKIADAMNVPRFGCWRTPKSRPVHSRESARPLQRAAVWEEEDPDPSSLDAGSPVALGFYETQLIVLEQSGAEMDSAQAEPSTLDAGQVIEVVESVRLDSNIVRLRCAQGWISLKPHLLIKLEDHRPEDTPKHKSVAALKASLETYNTIVCTGESVELKQQMVVTRISVFPERPALSFVGASDSVAETAKLQAQVEGLQRTVDSQNDAFAMLPGKRPECSMEDAKSASAAAKEAMCSNAAKEAADLATASAREELHALQASTAAEVSSLEVEIAGLKAGLQVVAKRGMAQDATLEMETVVEQAVDDAIPAEAEAMLARAQAADIETACFSLRHPYNVIQTTLPQELIEEVFRRLSISSLKTARQVCRSFASIVNDDLFAGKRAIDMYGKEFWVRASARPVHSSQPMKRVIDELLRIEKFQENVQKLHDRRFQAVDFYKMWRVVDRRRKGTKCYQESAISSKSQLFTRQL